MTHPWRWRGAFATSRRRRAIALLERVSVEGMLVPMLWHLELANVLQSAVRRNRITRQLRDASISDLQDLPLMVDDETVHHAWSATLALADRYDLTVYDASYLELAQRTELPLATLDRQLAEAARLAGVEVLP